MKQLAFIMLNLLIVSVIVASKVVAFLPDLTDNEDLWSRGYQQLRHELSQPSHEEGSGYGDNFTNDPGSVSEAEDDKDFWDTPQIKEQIKKCESIVKYHNIKRHKMCDNLPMEIWKLKREVDEMVKKISIIKKNEKLEKTKKRNRGWNTDVKRN